MRSDIEKMIFSADTVAITGHIRPDGDCIGSCLGLKNYLVENYSLKRVEVFLEPFSEKFGFLKRAGEVCFAADPGFVPDLAFCLDCSGADRLGYAAEVFEAAAHTVCIDHHATNDGSFAELTVLEAGISSTSELLCTLMDADGISRDTAECLYTGIVHDTGVFKHTNTSPETLRTAAMLLAKGVVPEHIINDTFYKKTFTQNKILGTALNNARLHLDGSFITAVLTKDEMDRLGVRPSDLDGIVDQLHVTDGVAATAFLYELPDGSFKGSLRAHGDIDVSALAAMYGGGGHIKAAGFSSGKTPDELIAEMAEKLKEQL